LGRIRGISLGTGKDGVLRWERGRQPDRPTRVLIAELLGIPEEAAAQQPWPIWLSADPVQQPAHHCWNASGAVEALYEVSGSDMEIDRRSFALLTGATLTASLMSWLTADPAAAGQISHGQRIGETAVAHIERRVRELRHADDTDGGGQLLEEAHASMGMVAQLLKDRSYTDAHGARLHAAAADFARMRAWAAFDTRGECPDDAFDAALHAAHAASDTALGAHVLAFWSIAAYNTERPADAEAMVTAALSAARGRTTDRVMAMLLSRRARARAHQNDPNCWADLDRSAELLDASDHAADEDPDWVYWYDRCELLGAIASTHLDMGQPGRAEAVFAQAASLYPADRVRTHALFLSRQADAQWRQNDLERACATAGHALDLTADISSHRSTGPLLELAANMRPHNAVPAVRDFRERATAILAA
jgi:tetratricopeptide (TPR) repeat protein